MLGDHFCASFFKFDEEMKHKMINCQIGANLSFQFDFFYIYICLCEILSFNNYKIYKKK